MHKPLPTISMRFACGSCACYTYVTYLKALLAFEIARIQLSGHLFPNRRQVLYARLTERQQVLAGKVACTLEIYCHVSGSHQLTATGLCEAADCHAPSERNADVHDAARCDGQGAGRLSG